MLSLLARRFTSVCTDLLFPPICAACEVDLVSSREVLLCDACHSSFRKDVQPRCPTCAMPVARGITTTTCSYCQPMSLPIAASAVLGNYDSQLRSIVLRCKHSRGEQLAYAVGQILGEKILEKRYEAQPAALRENSSIDAQPANSWSKINLVVPVPMHWLKRMFRGASSAEAIACGVAAKLEVPLVTQAIGCRRFLAKQGSLNRRKRAKNVRSAYQETGEYDLRGASILLVDDVLTTMATAVAVASALRGAGASQVLVATLVRSNTFDS